MAKLRLLCVFVVLAVVCWEANASASGAVFKVKKVVYQRKQGLKYYSIKSSCVRSISKQLHKKCDGKQKCLISADTLARKGRCKVNRNYCLQVTTQCHR